MGIKKYEGHIGSDPKDMYEIRGIKTVDARWHINEIITLYVTKMWIGTNIKIIQELYNEVANLLKSLGLRQKSLGQIEAKMTHMASKKCCYHQHLENEALAEENPPDNSTKAKIGANKQPRKRKKQTPDNSTQAKIGAK